MTLCSTMAPLVETCDALLVDLDGVVYLGPEPIPGAAAALQKARDLGVNVVFVTNNSNRTAAQVAAHLTHLGIPAQSAEVLTSAQAVTRLIQQHFATPATGLVVGGLGLREELTRVGFNLVASAKDEPDFVVQGFNPKVSWLDLAEAAYAISAGAKYFASNLDLTIPNDRGTAPGNGSLVLPVVQATGVEPIAAGKPNAEMFLLAAEQAEAERPLVIGDRLDTDLLGANNAGLPGMLVFTGVTDTRTLIQAPAAQRPQYLGAGMEALFTPHPQIDLASGIARVGQCEARLTAGQLEVFGPDRFDRIRAGVALAWSALDAQDNIDFGNIELWG